MWIRRVLPFLAAFLAMLALPVFEARTAELEGQHDPEFRRAVDRWLDGQELTALRKLGLLAEQGNIAAALLLGRLEDHAGPEPKELPRRERRKLYRDMSARRWGKNWWFALADRGHPLATALVRSLLYDDRQTMRQALDFLLKSGEREAFLDAASLRAANYDPPLYLLIDQIATSGDFHQTWTWLGRDLAAWGREHIEVDERDARHVWPEAPWNTAVEADVAVALAEGRLSALVFAAMNTRKPRGTKRVPLLQWITLPWGYPDTRPTREELRGVGIFLAKESAHGGYLRPLHDICRTSCPATVPMCMVSGLVAAGSLRRLADRATPLETAIPQKRWLASRQVRVALLQRMRRVNMKSRPPDQAQRWHWQDACLGALLIPEPGAPGR